VAHGHPAAPTERGPVTVPTPTTMTPASLRGRGLAVLAAVLTVFATLQVAAAPQARAATPVTYQGAVYPTAGPSPTEDKPQSKLWYNDGAW
jgi:hypothetical protein